MSRGASESCRPADEVPHESLANRLALFLAMYGAEGVLVHSPKLPKRSIRGRDRAAGHDVRPGIPVARRQEDLRRTVGELLEIRFSLHGVSP
jgi:hypothetical protein